MWSHLKLSRKCFVIVNWLGFVAKICPKPIMVGCKSKQITKCTGPTQCAQVDKLFKKQFLCLTNFTELEINRIKICAIDSGYQFQRFVQCLAGNGLCPSPSFWRRKKIQGTDVAQIRAKYAHRWWRNSLIQSFVWFSIPGDLLTLGDDSHLPHRHQAEHGRQICLQNEREG